MTYTDNCKLAKNPRTARKTLRILATDIDYDVRYLVARNPNTPPETLQTLATDSYMWVRFWVAQHLKTPPETLQTLATDRYGYVRDHVGRNPNSTELTRRLVMMTNDKESLSETP